MSRNQALFMAATAVVALVAGCKSANESYPAAAVQQETPAPPATEPQVGAMTGQLQESCPTSVDGATVEVADTADGVGLTFATRSGDAKVLRARVRRMAEMYGSHTDHQDMMWHRMAGPAGGYGRTGEGHGPGGGMMGGPGGGMMGGPAGGMMGGAGAADASGMATADTMMPAATATVEDVDGGARIVLVPTDAAQLDSLRGRARMHRERMHSGECPIPRPAPEQHTSRR